MDTHSTEFSVSATEAIRRLVDQVLSGGDAVLTVGAGGRDVLDQAAEQLDPLRLRVLRVSAAAPGGLSLSGLMAQVTDQPDLTAHDDEVLERGFQALTVPGGTFDGIVLMVSDAQALQRTALRYVQFACRAGSTLRLVLAGERGPDLMGDEVSSLRTRLAAHPVIVVASGAPPVPLSGPLSGPPTDRARAPHPVAGRTALLPAPAVPAAARPMLSRPPTLLARPAPARPRQRAIWAAVALGMAGSTASGLWAGRHGLPDGPATQAARPGPDRPPAPAVTPAPTEAALPSASPPASLPVPAGAAPAVPAPSQAAAPQRHAAHSRDPVAPRRSPPPASRPLASARPPEPRSRSTVDWDAPLPTPLQDARSWRASPPYAPWDGAPRTVEPAIGTYATDEYGMRAFRSGR